VYSSGLGHWPCHRHAVADREHVVLAFEGFVWYEPPPTLAMFPRTNLPRPTLRPPLVGDHVRELRRAGVAAAKLYVRRRSSFHGWLQGVLLRKHALTSCSCGLINCR